MLDDPAKRGLPLFQAYPRLGEAVPWLALGDWPTPVTEARHFAAAKGLKAFYIKREDLSHPECGGNKVRGLEFILAEARRRGAGTILTLGAAGSHHVSRTAWHARRLGLGTVGAGVIKCLTENGDLISARTGIRPVVRQAAVQDIDKKRTVSLD
ncbi:MAG: pyridoxal-phosphate dependent enzyme, partial [Planctomycetes bacterium]|nr:pyridoxal-phosphate dependent enzyme [Planctomycetota bacterium]